MIYDADSRPESRRLLSPAPASASCLTIPLILAGAGHLCWLSTRLPPPVSQESRVSLGFHHQGRLGSPEPLSLPLRAVLSHFGFSFYPAAESDENIATGH